MKSIDVVNVNRVWSSIAVRKITTQKKSIAVKSATIAADPTILSTREKNARLVFYAAIQSDTKKDTTTRTARRRSFKTVKASTQSLGARMEQLIRADQSKQPDTVRDIQVDPVTHTLPLFNQIPELTHTVTNTPPEQSKIDQAVSLLHRASKTIASLPHMINNKASSTRSIVTKFVKQINRKQHNA